MATRRLVALALAVILAAPLARVWAECESRAPTGEPVTMTEVYAKAKWYLMQPDVEEEFQGTLQRREVAAGPATRTALRYTLVTDAESLAVYAPNSLEKLEPFVGRRVVVRGKLVDLGAEGSRPELWIGSIGPAEGMR
jgi:hypothetical protein